MTTQKRFQVPRGYKRYRVTLAFDVDAVRKPSKTRLKQAANVLINSIYDAIPDTDIDYIHLESDSKIDVTIK